MRRSLRVSEQSRSFSKNTAVSFSRKSRAPRSTRRHAAAALPLAGALPAPRRLRELLLGREPRRASMAAHQHGPPAPSSPSQVQSEGKAAPSSRTRQTLETATTRREGDSESRENAVTNARPLSCLLISIFTARERIDAPKGVRNSTVRPRSLLAPTLAADTPSPSPSPTGAPSRAARPDSTRVSSTPLSTTKTERSLPTPPMERERSAETPRERARLLRLGPLSRTCRQTTCRQTRAPTHNKPRLARVTFGGFAFLEFQAAIVVVASAVESAYAFQSTTQLLLTAYAPSPRDGPAFDPPLEPDDIHQPEPLNL